MKRSTAPHFSALIINGFYVCIAHTLYQINTLGTGCVSTSLCERREAQPTVEGVFVDRSDVSFIQTGVELGQFDGLDNGIDKDLDIRLTDRSPRQGQTRPHSAFGIVPPRTGRPRKERNARLSSGASMQVVGDGAVAYMNILRHAEKSDDSGNDLTQDGQHRAEYYAKCMGPNSNLSDAMPFGAAAGVMAPISLPGESDRPRQTVQPLADALSVQVQMPCDQHDTDCFSLHVQEQLEQDTTLVVAWTYPEIPKLLRALALSEDVLDSFTEWPPSCDSASWPEPAYCRGGSTCYDLIWRVTFVASHVDAWNATNVSSFQAGFGGAVSSPCAEGLAPWTT